MKQQIDDEQLTSSTEELKLDGYTVTISPHIHDRIEQHIIYVKKLSDPNSTKQRWILHAVQEKLSREEKDQDIPKERRLNIKLDKVTSKKVLKRVDLIKKFRTSYSKKQWFVDALLEKLEQEEQEIKKKLSEI